MMDPDPGPVLDPANSNFFVLYSSCIRFKTDNDDSDSNSATIRSGILLRKVRSEPEFAQV